MLHIFTHDDADGYASGYLVYKHFKTESNLKENEYKYHFMNYNKEFPFNQIDKYDIVFITDFSINPEDMIKLHKITPYVIWIDHHISSIEKYKDWDVLVAQNYFNTYNKEEIKVNFIIDGLRMNGISGCALTWLYLYKGWTEDQKIQAFNEIGEQEIFNIMMKDFENAPEYLKLINDWDVWNLKFKDTKPFILALNNNLSIKNINKLDNEANYHFCDDNKSYLEKLIDLGNTYIDYRDNWAAQLRDKYGYKTELLLDENKSYKVYCLNVGNANSDYSGDELLNKYDIICHYCFNGTRYVYSMYSKKDYIDCASLCKYFGVDNGGGHKGAAGFTHKDLLFKKNELISILDYKKEN